jgi:hypothetical protein
MKGKPKMTIAINGRQWELCKRYYATNPLSDLPQDFDFDFEHMLATIDIETVLSERNSAGYAGKFAKRVKRYFAVEHRVKLDNNLQSTIGELANRHSQIVAISNGNYDPDIISETGLQEIKTRIKDRFELIEYDFTDCIDWNAGDFGDNGSCYFYHDTYKHSKQAITDNDGYAMRFYNGDGGIARAFIVPYADGAIVFNGKGAFNTLEISKTLAMLAGHDPDNPLYIGFSVNGAQHSVPYIDDACLVASDHENYIDLSWDIPYTHSCAYCHGDIDTEYGDYYTVDYYGTMLCESCYHEHYSYCETCGEDYPIEDIYQVGEYTYVCETCRADNYSECEHCETWIHNDDINEFNGDDAELLCDDCLESHYIICDDCDYVFKPDNIWRAMDQFYCKQCYIDAFECEPPEPINLSLKKMTNAGVIDAWINGELAQSHNGNLSTFGGFLYSYDMLIAVTTRATVFNAEPARYVIDCESYSRTTSQHITAALWACGFKRGQGITDNGWRYFAPYIRDQFIGEHYSLVYHGKKSLINSAHLGAILTNGIVER